MHVVYAVLTTLFVQKNVILKLHVTRKIFYLESNHMHFDLLCTKQG
jgi:hypothetical protein